MKPYGFLGIYAVLAFLWIAGCGSRSSRGNVVARVGDASLTYEAMRQRMEWQGLRPDQESEFVNRWVNRELLYQEAKRLGLNDAVDLQWELDLVEKEYLINKLLERVYSERIQITDQEIESYYAKNRELFEVKEDEARVLHLLTKTKAEADFALQEIKAGKAFEKVAKERSIDMFREQGGDMGFIRRSDVIPEVARVVFGLHAGGESPVFHSSYGYHIVRVLKKYRSAEIKAIEDVKSDIVRRLRIERERTAYYDYLVQIQNKSKVSLDFPKDRSMNSDSLGRSGE